METLLQGLCARYRVHSASTCLLTSSGAELAAFGYEDADATCPATPDSRFLIGSMSKLLTALAVMLLVDEGHLQLDELATSYLPAREAELAVLEGVSLRHLLTHSSGMEGDVLISPSQADDALEVYMHSLASCARLHPPGTGFSYCNSGFAVLARLVELRRGCPFDVYLVEHLFPLLGMHQSGAWHLGIGGVPMSEPLALDPVTGKYRRAVFDDKSRALAGAGATVFSTAADMGRLALLLLGSGNLDGVQILSQGGYDAMVGMWREGPCYTFAQWWGLGIMHWRNDADLPLFGHSGFIHQYQNCLWVMPTIHGALVALFNGGAGSAVHRALFDATLGQWAGTRLTVPDSELPRTDVDLSNYCGEYLQPRYRLGIEREGDLLRATLWPGKHARDFDRPLSWTLRPLDRELFLSWPDGPASANAEPLLQRFIDVDRSGVPLAINFRGRHFSRAHA